MAVQYRELLQLVMHVLNKPTMEAKQNLPTVSRKIAQCVTVLGSFLKPTALIYYFYGLD